MKFLAGVNALTQDNLDLLWKGCNSTHEEYVRAVYDTIIELSSEISVEVFFGRFFLVKPFRILITYLQK